MSQTTGAPRIGVAGPLSGPLSSYGKVLSVVEEEVRRVGLEAQVLVHDDAASEPEALRVAAALIAAGCVAVVGHFNSACALAVAPCYAAAEVPFLAPCTTHPGLLEATSFALRYCADTTAQVALLRQFLTAQGIRPASPLAVVHDGTTYGLSLAETWSASAAPGTVSLDADANLDAAVHVYFGKLPAALAYRARQRKRSPSALFIASDDCHIGAFAEANGSDVEGTYVVGSCEGHAGAVRRAAAHLATTLKSNRHLRGRPLRDQLRQGHQELRFDERGQRLDTGWSLFQVQRQPSDPATGTDEFAYDRIMSTRRRLLLLASASDLPMMLG